jgi:superfamily II DNA or RNA helicase
MTLYPWEDTQIDDEFHPINTDEMNDINVTQPDAVYLKVDCERGVAQELSDFFTFKVPGYQFMPAYRNKMWDGNIRLFNTYDKKLYAGLADYLSKFAQDRGYPFNLCAKTPYSSSPMNRDELKDYLNSLQLVAAGKDITPHDHQVDAISTALNDQRCLLLSPTASGKSLIIYSTIRYLLDSIESDTKKKILLVVPTVGLVNQMYADFLDYSQKNGWDVKHQCQKIFSGQEKTTKARVIISTWQSIFRMKADYYQDFFAVFGDECHLFKAKSLTSIMEKAKNAYYRIGTTGTLDGTQTHKLVIEGLFGKVVKVTSTKDLMDKNLLSDLSIECITLKYPEEERRECKGMKYADEIKWLTEHKKRNRFISEMAVNLKGNTLVLFQFIEHGKTLHQQIQKLSEGKHQVFLVYGATEADTREEVRQLAEANENAIIVASYGTFSTGISIRRLHNVVFASPSKSRIRVLQSIGRQLRKSEHKTCAKLFDIGDDLSIKSHRNHTLKHLTERVNLYIQEKFNYRLVRLDL